MSKKYIPEGSWLACDKGTCPSSFRITNNNNTNIYGSKLASEADLLPFLNIKPMGLCSVSFSICVPAVLKWDDPQDDVMVGGFRLLKEDSTCKCVLGGKIKIFLDRAAAAANCIAGEIKMPTEYIKEGFDWVAEQNAKGREARDSMLPDWMKSVSHVTDWMEDVKTGLVEGAVNGVVGMAEGIYQIAQDPVGTAEAIGSMASEGYNAAKEGLSNAAEWAGDGDNWSNAYESTKKWAAESDNWKAAASSAWEGTKGAAQWVAKNPRKIGTTVGQFIPDVAAAIYTAGGSEAASAAKIAAKEAAELAEETAAKQVAKQAAEKLAKEEAARLGEKALVREAEDVVGEVAAKGEKELAEEAAMVKSREQQIAESRDAYNKTVQSHSNLPESQKVKTTASDDINTVSGHAPKRISAKTREALGVTDVSPKQVMDRADEIGHSLSKNASIDNGVPGQAAASHAEKQVMTAKPGDPIGVSRGMCSDCIKFAQKHADEIGKDVIVTDPSGTKIFEPGGTSPIDIGWD